MEKCVCCEDCIFFEKDGYQDMGAKADTCKLIAHHKSYDIWESILDGEPVNFPCGFFESIEDAIKNKIGNSYKGEE